MDYYIDLNLHPTKENRENVLLNQIYMKIHYKLVDLKSTQIGISFPKHHITLGRQLRLHGHEADLQSLLQQIDLSKFGNSISSGSVSLVPSTCSYRTVSRKQPLMSPSKMRRLLKRGSLTEEDAKNYRRKLFTKGLSEPYLELESNSSQQKYRRYITHSPIQKTATVGTFDQFGLSKTATIPWF